MNFNTNCCDGIYNSFDVHFTKYCDNNCKRCIDKKYSGLDVLPKPNKEAIVNTIISNAEGFDDVLFLGGEPCLFLEELIWCIENIKSKTNIKCYVTSSMPKVLKDKEPLFHHLSKTSVKPPPLGVWI